MQIQPYVFFEGRCEEAVEFYRRALGAQVEMLMRYKDSPEPPQPGMLPPGAENKVMHAALRIGETTILASDGHCQGRPTFEGFSLFGAGSITHATATQQAAVRADVGGYADITAAGDVHVRGSFIGATQADASSASAAGVVGLSIADGTATHTPTVNAKVGANADITSNANGGKVELIAEQNHDGTGFLTNKGAIATAASVAFSIGFSDADATVNASSNATVETLVEAGATLNAVNNGTVSAVSQSSNTAAAALNTVSAGAVSIRDGDASPVANGSTATRFLGNVGDGVSSGANAFNVLAEGYTAANGAMS